MAGSLESLATPAAPPVSEFILLLIAVVSLALIGGGVIWARRRAERASREAASQELELEQALIAGGRATVKAALKTAARVREQGFGGAFRSSVEQLAGWAEVEQPDLRRLAARDGTVTILFSDIEDSTAMNEELGDRAWLRILGAHDSIVRDRVGEHDGHVVKSQGDGFMVAFASPEEAVRCAIDIQRALASGSRRLRKTPIRIRIGIHVGKAVAKDGDLFGRNVALAARVAGCAHGGEILVSSQVEEAAAGLDGVALTSPREVELKGLPGQHRLLAVQWKED
jgi:class 3 adenylate cyclase